MSTGIRYRPFLLELECYGQESGNQPDAMFYVPDNAPSLAAIAHWGNHWAMVVANTRTLSRIFRLHGAARPKDYGYHTMMNFLNMHPHPQYNT